MDLNAKPYIDRLEKYVEDSDFAGYDPYDALNSPILKIVSLKSRIFRILLIQLLKKFPVNIRPILGIEKGHNPKALGLFLWSYAKRYAGDKKAACLDRVMRLLNLLEATKSRGYAGNCWGYNFDWQSRVFYLPKFTPTVVNSAFIGHALIDTYRMTGIERAMEMALSIGAFITTDLQRSVERNGQCLSYTPIDRTKIHNANLLGASLLIRMYRTSGQERLRETALACLDYSMRHQRLDGSWTYAETERQKWIDSFHTGFNLQSILYFMEEGFAEAYETAFDRGVRFYRDNFFMADGTPKYYHDRIYPMDIHGPCQAIVFFSKMGGQHETFATVILKWMLKNMSSDLGYFYFQKYRGFTNRIPYIRWSQAWALHALTEYDFRWRRVGAPGCAHAI